IASREALGVTRLEFELLMLGRYYATPIVGGNPVSFKPGLRARAKTEGGEHNICRQDVFRTRDNNRAATPLRIWFTQLGGNHFNAFHLAVTHYFDGLAIIEKLNPFFFRIRYFALGARHMFFVAAVGAGYAACTLTDRGPVTVHRSVTTTQHDHPLPFNTDKVRRIFFKTHIAIHI